MNYKKLTYRYLRKMRILPRLEYVLNEQGLNIQKAPLQFTLHRPEKGASYLIEGKIRSSAQEENPKAALVGVDFYNIWGKRIIPEKNCNPRLSWSKKVGNYKYISCSDINKKFSFSFSAPAKCYKAKIVIYPWAEKKRSIVLWPGTKLLTIGRKKIEGLEQIISAISTSIQNGVRLSDININQLFIAIPQVRRLEALKQVFEYFFTSDEFIIAEKIATFIFNNYQLEDYRDRVRDIVKNYSRSGNITSHYDFLNNVVKAGFYKKPPGAYKIVEDQSAILESGFPLHQEVVSKPPYKARKSSLYLLHNSMPYNSGGYATRTHGLVKGIVENSDFELRCLTKPGYPMDYAKYISRPLPEHIPEKDVVEGIEYIRSSVSADRVVTSFTDYNRYYEEELIRRSTQFEVSVIHAASNYLNGIAAVNAAKKLGIASVYEVRGLWEITRLSREPLYEQTEHYHFYSYMETLALQNATAAITITGALKNMMQERGVTREIFVVPNAVDTEKFQPQHKDEALIAELGLKDKVVIGYAGSVVNYEGLDDLMSACAMLKKRRINNFAIVIVGDGAEVEKIKLSAKDNGIDEQVIFTGRVPHTEVSRYISVMDIMPFPRKPFLVCEAVSPLKPFESLASRKAVLVSSCAALTEIIKDGETGMVFAKGNINDMAEKLAILIENPQLRETLAENGLNWVRRERDWKQVAKTVADIYKEISSNILFP